MKTYTETKQRWIVTYGGKADKDRAASGFSEEKWAIDYYLEKIREGNYASVFVETVTTKTEKVK